MTFSTAILAALLNEELVRAIERLRRSIAEMEQDIRDLEKEQARWCLTPTTNSHFFAFQS
jgi:hypothetical protein